ncbi:MAG: hypothetical protein Q8K00_08095 [Syntrophales bacterium]|nr:hypothetical protein [Syntrophales bacterium]
MNEQSRIRFNPVTKEIEIEGSEAFVKTYFNKLQAMMSGVTEKPMEVPKGAKTRPAEKGKIEPKEARPRPAKKAVKAAQMEPGKKKVTHIAAIVGLVQANADGISTATLKEKTGLAERQIWSIVDRAAKEGKIRKIKRGLYGAV